EPAVAAAGQPDRGAALTRRSLPMHGAAYLRKALLPHLANALEEYLWLAAQVSEALLDAVPAGAPASVRQQVLELALDLDVAVYPLLIALLKDKEPPQTPGADAVARQRAAWWAADLMVAMKQ